MLPCMFKEHLSVQFAFTRGVCNIKVFFFFFLWQYISGVNLLFPSWTLCGHSQTSIQVTVPGPATTTQSLFATSHCIVCWLQKRQPWETISLLKSGRASWSSVLIPDNAKPQFSSDHISILSLRIPYLYKRFMFHLSQCLEVRISFMHFDTSVFNLDPSLFFIVSQRLGGFFWSCFALFLTSNTTFCYTSCTEYWQTERKE